jgi:hypothetical protein
MTLLDEIAERLKTKAKKSILGSEPSLIELDNASHLVVTPASEADASAIQRSQGAIVKAAKGCGVDAVYLHFPGDNYCCELREKTKIRVSSASPLS